MEARPRFKSGTTCPWGPWKSEAEYTSALRQQTASHDRIYYAVRLASGGKACGQICFLDIQPEQGVIEIGAIWFGLTLRRTRSATELMYLMLRYAMDDLRYRRMQWRCNALNANSRAAARRLGFRFEGIFHNHMIFKGRNRDTAWYSILDDEWPEVREILERWLAPGNFDQDGIAKTSLAALMEKRGPSRRIEPARRPLFDPLGEKFFESMLAKYWSGRRDSNPRPRPWQGRALPLSYTRIR